MAKIKNIKRSEGKVMSYIQRNSHSILGWIQSRNSAGQKGVAWYIQSDEKEKSTAKNTILARLLFQFKGQREFTEKKKAKKSSKFKALNRL